MLAREAPDVTDHTHVHWLAFDNVVAMLFGANQHKSHSEASLASKNITYCLCFFLLIKMNLKISTQNIALPQFRSSVKPPTEKSVSKIPRFTVKVNEYFFGFEIAFIHKTFAVKNFEK